VTDLTPKRRTVRLRRILRWFVRPVIVLCLLFYLGFYVFQEIKLFESDKKPTGYVDRPRLRPEFDRFVELGDGKINYQKFLALTKSREGTVFFLHGNRGSIYQCRWVIEPFLKAGYDVWIMDYRGFGMSTGRRSEAALLADAQMVYKRIRADVNEEDIIVWGRSFGSGIAAFVAAGNSPKALVLETPYWSLPDAACHSYPILFPFLFRYELPTHEFLGNVDCQIYLIHGTADEKIYFGASERLERLGNDLGKRIRLRDAPGGKHNLRSDPRHKGIPGEILERISVDNL
jgi:uncharacterized protein